MTTAELNAAIAAGTMTVTKLPTRRPNPRHLVMTRVGGSRSHLQGQSPDGRKAVATVQAGKAAYHPQRRKIARFAT